MSSLLLPAALQVFSQNTFFFSPKHNALLNNGGEKTTLRNAALLTFQHTDYLTHALYFPCMFWTHAVLPAPCVYIGCFIFSVCVGACVGVFTHVYASERGHVCM